MWDSVNNHVWEWLKKEVIIESGVVNVQDATRDTIPGLIETLPYFELCNGKYCLERQNHGAPQCPEIALNEKKKASRMKPQAWSRKIDEKIHWFYNYPGACAEAKYLNKRIPTIDEWMEMLNSISGNTEEKSVVLNIPMIGHRPESGRWSRLFPPGACLYSSSTRGDELAYYAVLAHGFNFATGGWDYRGRGASLRFLADKE